MTTDTTTTTTTDKMTELAHQFLDSFDVSVLDQPSELGSMFRIRLRADSPDWVAAAVWTAHGDVRAPNDWVHLTCRRILAGLLDRDPKEWRTAVAEIADIGVDIYGVDRARWLASDVGFFRDVDKAVRVQGHSPRGIAEDLAAGQRLAAKRIALTLIDAISAEAGFTARV